MATPQLYFQAGGIAERVAARCPELKEAFSPTIWAPDAHSQSALGMLRTLTARGSYTRQLVMTSDHGTLGLDWWCGSDKGSWAAPDAPVVLFIHGINGGSHEGYVKWACVAAAARGWRCVVLNMRGCNGLPLTSARGYNAINTSDVHVAVQSIHARFPAAPLMAAGYSLGSVLLAKYLAEADNGLYSSSSSGGGSSSGSSGDSSSGGEFACAGAGAVPDPARGSGLVAAALVSPPVCLHSTNAKMGRPNSVKFLYNLAVAYKLREYVKEHLPTIKASGMNINAEAMLRSWTVASFDDAVTLRALGYASPSAYYRHACSTNYLPHLRTPTLVLTSRDDPFLGVLPQEQAQANPFTLLATTRRGGHLAFLQGWWPLGASYCDRLVDGWLGAALQEWRHGCTQAGQPLPQPQPLPPLRAAPGSSSSGRRGGGAPPGCPQQPRLPTWVERAAAGGWRPEPFDPTSLANVLCSCSPGAEPLAQAQAADAGLNAAAAPAAQLAAAAASTAAAAAAAPRKGSGSGSGANALYAWAFGFGGGGGGGTSAATTPGSALPGLRPSGAWAPFDDPDPAPPGDRAMPGGGAAPGGRARAPQPAPARSRL